MLNIIIASRKQRSFNSSEQPQNREQKLVPDIRDVVKQSFSPTICLYSALPNLAFDLFPWASQVALVVKNLPANAGDIRDKGDIPELGRSRGGGHGNPLQYSCLKNPMDKGAW